MPRKSSSGAKAGNLLRIDFGTVKDADIRLRNLRLREMTDAERAEDRGRKRERPECIGLRGTAQKEYLHASYTSKVEPRRGDRRQNPHHGQLCGRRELPALRTAALRRHHPHRDRLPEIRHTAHAESVRRHARPHGLARRISLRPAAVAMGRRMPHGRGRPHRLARPLCRRGRRAAQPAARTDAVEEGTGRILRRRLHERSGRLGHHQRHGQRQSVAIHVPVARKGRHGRTRLLRRNLLFRHRKLDALDATLRETPHATLPSRRSCWSIPPQRRATPNSGALLQHPDYTRGTYTMPNMTTPKAVRYAAMIDFLAQRTTAAEDDAYGRIAHWIVHNEVDGGVDWTNMGDDKLITTSRTPTSNRCACAPRSSTSTTPTPNSSPRSPIRGAALRTRAGIPCATWSGCSAISVARKATFAGRSPATVTPRRSPTPVRGANRMRLSR